jgi:ribose transport system ATP-binding protein
MSSEPDRGRGGRAPELLRAQSIGKGFAGVTALDQVDFDLRAGEVHALVGENGAGKSTLMKILSGVHADYDGEVQILGEQVRFTSVRDAERSGVAIIHQELNLVPELGVAANILLGREPLIFGLLIDSRAMIAAAKRLLERLGIQLDPEARVAGLRVGEQQLVEIAKALSIEARILIMDEPTSALTPTECARLFRIVRQLAADGVGVVYISHRLDEVTALADRVTVLRDGRNVVTAPIGEMDRDRMIAAMVGRQTAAGAAASARAGGAPVLEVRGLSLEVPGRRGWQRVLHGVDFEVCAGEVLGISGLLGSGRTEILETLFGASAGRSGGDIRIAGEPVGVASPRDACRLGIALVTEDRKAKGLHLDASIRDNVTLPSLARLARFGVRMPVTEAGAARDAVRRLRVRCTGIEQVTATLSGGNQQKVVIGKWLATRPRLLLLDEPTRGIDVGAKQEIYDLVRALADDGLAIVMVSSELPELLLLADRIMVVSEGRKTGVLSREDASEEAIMQLAAPRGSKVGAVAS